MQNRSIVNNVNQDSGALLTISFFDDFGNPTVPATAIYTIVDVNSLTALVVPTAINNLAEVISLEIPPSVNALINQRLALEPKAFTVTYTFWNGSATVTRVDELKYSVIRMYGRINEDNAL